MIRKRLFVLLACLFVTMIGFGITLPVLPFYVERLALASGAPPQSAALHVGLLTAVYALVQLFFAPLWGRWSDRIGRRPLVLIGIMGYVIAQILFGLATSLPLLYAARILGGILSSATLPAAARTTFFVFALVGLFALGMALISPNLAAMISKRGGQQAGAALGVQNAANSIGQAGGPLLGGALFVWEMNAPYVLTGALLITVTLMIAWRARDRQRIPESAL